MLQNVIEVDTLCIYSSSYYLVFYLGKSASIQPRANPPRFVARTFKLHLHHLDSLCTAQAPLPMPSTHLQPFFHLTTDPPTTWRAHNTHIPTRARSKQIPRNIIFGEQNGRLEKQDPWPSKAPGSLPYPPGAPASAGAPPS